MRTTLDIDDTVLAAARSLAQADGVSLGTAVSRLALRGLRGEQSSPLQADIAYADFPILLGSPDHPVTSELIAAHRDEE